ncbi:MAG TPA: hypothetical protein VMW35_03555 [Myxococcota bacterium]|nr:hypothetical protein [Myxococcota bacterium]
MAEVARTQPAAIDDVVTALVRVLELPLATSAWFDIPGPVTLSGKEILEETAPVMGLRQPRMVEVPLLSPRLSSLRVRFVTRAQGSVARLTEDLLARDDRFWELVGHPHRLSFAEAARVALDAGRGDRRARGTWGAIERVRGLSKSSAWTATQGGARWGRRGRPKVAMRPLRSQFSYPKTRERAASVMASTAGCFTLRSTEIA